MRQTEPLVELSRLTGVEVDTTPLSLEEVRADKSGHRSDSPPLAVVSALSIDSVQEVMRWATRHRVPVVTRGGGSGLAGGAIGREGEVVLSLDKMNSILDISTENRTARVEAGVINQVLNDAAREHGLWFGPDPASRQWSTVGGNIATNAGGLMCAKYGVTRESVLALTVVLANGDLIVTGHQSVKGVTGFDITQLFIGSEGLLGVIVEATVKLLPLPPHDTWTIGARFPSISTATAACQALITAGHTPAVLELVDDVALPIIHDYLDLPPAEAGQVLLIAQSDGPAAREDVRAFADVFAGFDGRTEMSGPGDIAEALLHLRRSMHPAMESRGTVLIEDVAVPRSQLGAMFEHIRRIERDYGLSIPTVAHAADGNLHPNFIVEGPDVPQLVWDAADDLFRFAVSLGGTLTGEHGVGLLKKRWLVDELGERQWQLQRDIKDVFDPHNLLNPGKVFDPAT